MQFRIADTFTASLAKLPARVNSWNSPIRLLHRLYRRFSPCDPPLSWA